MLSIETKGPKAWAEIHEIANHTENALHAYKCWTDIIKKLPTNCPCKTEGLHILNQLVEYTPNFYSFETPALESFAIFFHNIINIKLNKPLYYNDYNN